MGASSENSVPSPRVANSDPGRLAELMGISQKVPTAWNADELGAVLRHQLTAPVQFDLAQLDRGDAFKLVTVADAGHLLLRSFNDLLHHPHPPLALLEMVKEFAKANLNHPDSPLPPEIANVFYYASIMSALITSRRKITKLDNAQLREGVEATLAQPWLDEPTRSLLRRGLDVLNTLPAAE